MGSAESVDRGSASGDDAAHDSDAPDGGAQVVSTESLWGFRVMKVFAGSPAARSGLAPFDDFILAVDGVLAVPTAPPSGASRGGAGGASPTLRGGGGGGGGHVGGGGGGGSGGSGGGGGDGPSLGALLSAARGRPVSLLVWSCIDAAEREVALTPAPYAGPGLLGAAVRHEPLAGATDGAWHVLDVLPGSPADEAGLCPGDDWVVGTAAAVFRHEAEFGAVLGDAAAVGGVASLMVYSAVTGRVRGVEVSTGGSWEGGGVLGAETANGLLHAIPRREGAGRGGGV
ncbi:hypothetical protein I4F81_010135 [Pyropia yezoensis]|uniref:Uncharacterized protein n=1 Tax=Pyropia yezoensis TaxID=2788 RepID=A0ACC3CBL6_PYRYE|nr:hypothetical protein I4F81_010135 [Neopyropia yezoensis]